MESTASEFAISARIDDAGWVEMMIRKIDATADIAWAIKMDNKATRSVITASSVGTNSP